MSLVLLCRKTKKNLIFGAACVTYLREAHTVYTYIWTVSSYTLFESENEWQKIEQVSIPLPRASRNFPDVKTRNDFFFIIGLRR